MAIIDLAGADLRLFEQYEAKVLGLLPVHGARLEFRLRSRDEAAEYHLIDFPDEASLDAFRADPARAGLQDLWVACGASSRLVEVCPFS